MVSAAVSIPCIVLVASKMEAFSAAEREEETKSTLIKRSNFGPEL